MTQDKTVAKQQVQTHECRILGFPATFGAEIQLGRSAIVVDVQKYVQVSCFVAVSKIGIQHNRAIHPFRKSDLERSRNKFGLPVSPTI